MKAALYISYFENLARKHKSILHTDAQKHFYRLDIEEVLTGLRTPIKYPALILEMHEGRILNNASDNIRDLQTGAFMIVKQVSKKDDFKEEMSALEECLNIGYDIIARMWQDRHNRVLNSFDIGTVNYSKVGPVFDNAYGYRFTFGLDDRLPGYDSTKWNS